jgi:hypothetical protein
MADKKPAKPGRGTKSPRKKTRKKTARKSVRQAAAPNLYTLTQIGQMASVSMPTLQKYKRAYQDRIPSVGEGRKQRYPREAVAVLKQLKKENLAKRGRPPKSSAPPAKQAKKAKKAGTRAKKRVAAAKTSSTKSKTELLTLSEISRITNISYPTVSRYVKLFLERIPHVGAGRVRRFPSEAIAAFQQLRSESRPGRPRKSAAKAAPSKSAGKGAARTEVDLHARLKALEKSHADLSKQLAAVVELLKKPMQVTIGRR